MNTPSQANIVARHLGLSDPSHWKSIDDYVAQGGSTGEITQTRVTDSLRSLVTDSSKVGTPKSINKNYPGLYNYVMDEWPKGELYSREKLRKIVSQGIASGEVPGGAWYINDDEGSYQEAVQRGEGDEWMPDVTDNEKENIIQKLQAAGETVTEQKIKEYQKHIVLGIQRN
jgi:hypothetical protein